MKLAFALFMVGVAASWGATTSGGATCTSTNSDLSQALSSCSAPTWGLAADSNWVVTIYDQTGDRQTIDGFGAAWTDATVEVFDSLSAESQEQLLGELFGDSDDSISMKLSRHTVGQSDLTPEDIGAWSYDETSGDTELNDFALTPPGEAMASWLKRMQDMPSDYDITLLGSIWSIPTWMKQNQNLMWENRYVYTEYVANYLQEFAARGVKVDALTLQNEPLHLGPPEWTMFMDSSYAAVLSNLTRTKLDAYGIDTKLWAYDHNTDVPEYPQYILDNTPANTVEAVAWHCYASNVDWTVLSAFHQANPSVSQYMTECWLHLGTGEGFFDLPNFFTGPLQNYASGVLAWILGGSVNYDVGFPGGCGQCSGIIQVDMDAGTYEKTQDYYTLGQFSKFVEKSATYLKTDGNYDYPDGTGVQTVAFRNPSGSMVVVIVNKIVTPLKVNVQLESGEGYAVEVEGSSVTTLVL
mmetsp:Transcript_59258/g.163628  ORF Transcript_59258/g.163628 Transcript_59258/m.163628 type:complete len:467 (-) Transcript_59258:355-1755(-)|eukprot:CAMPEP_0119504698 /NCGR_PEP_ID=MMETSP1344-20130328/25470_1 /TAXON_ID=236787 /ORGANISM="Florenciella parvula, Strain CCMP2471" /LENGTH=466 /DNA_ID=CAMNT_0007541095 /DNA_START=100 /DNA_END=1500 /DNA_ORIENTATION=+